MELRAGRVNKINNGYWTIFFTPSLHLYTWLPATYLVVGISSNLSFFCSIYTQPSCRTSTRNKSVAICGRKDKNMLKNYKLHANNWNYFDQRVCRDLIFFGLRTAEGVLGFLEKSRPWTGRDTNKAGSRTRAAAIIPPVPPPGSRPPASSRFVHLTTTTSLIHPSTHRQRQIIRTIIFLPGPRQMQRPQSHPQLLANKSARMHARDRRPPLHMTRRHSQLMATHLFRRPAGGSPRALNVC